MPRESEYFIRRKNLVQFEVTKFSDNSDQPTAQYTVEVVPSRTYKARLACNCARWKKAATTECRHTEMVADFIREGEPESYRVVK